MFSQSQKRERKEQEQEKKRTDHPSITVSLRCNVIVKRYKDDFYEVILLKMSNKKEKLDLLKQKILKRVFLSGDSEYQYAQVEPLFQFL